MKTKRQVSFNLADLVDRRLDVDRQIDELTALKNALGAEIIDSLKKEGGNKVFGKNGVGYQLTTSIKQDFEPEAVSLVKRERLEHLFLSEPKITRAKLMSAFKADKLTVTQFNAISAFGGEVYEYHTLKTVQEKLA